MRFLRVLIGLVLFYFFLPPFFPIQAAGESWLTGYSYRRAITVDNTKVSDADSANFSNFPVLISLSGLTNIQDNGIDIRFTSSDGATQLPREIELYLSGTLVAWVKIPILSYNSDTVIYMYYGNSSATEPTASSDYGSQNVWTQNYVGVWHLKETGTNPTVYDSTSNANNSATQTWTPASGKIDGAGTFNGSSNSINIASNDGLNPAAITVSAWAKTSATKWQYVALKNHQWNFGRDADGKYYLGVWNASDEVVADEHTAAIATLGAWEHIVFTYNGSKAKYYVNQNLVIDKTVTENLYTTVNDVNIGSQGGSSSYWNGSIDDVKISDVARSAGWIATEYANQSSPSTFTSLASEEEYSVPVSTTTPAAITAPALSPSIAPGCGDSKPMNSPNLFEINRSETQATLYFTPVSNVNTYYISFSEKSIAEEHGALVTLSNEGVQSFTVNFLKPNTTYYFKVRGQNGCMPGDWGNVLSASTKPLLTNYQPIIADKLPPVLALETKTATPTPATIQTVVSVVHEKHCFLWLCW